MEFNFRNIGWKSQVVILVMLAALNQLSTSMVTNVTTILLPEISLDLGITVSTLNWITIIFFIASISVSIPLSKYNKPVRCQKVYENCNSGFDFRSASDIF